MRRKPITAFETAYQRISRDRAPLSLTLKTLFARYTTEGRDLQLRRVAGGMVQSPASFARRPLTAAAQLCWTSIFRPDARRAPGTNCHCRDDGRRALGRAFPLGRGLRGRGLERSVVRRLVARTPVRRFDLRADVAGARRLRLRRRRDRAAQEAPPPTVSTQRRTGS